jgi:hypothetical protein
MIACNVAERASELANAMEMSERFRLLVSDWVSSKKLGAPVSRITA